MILQKIKLMFVLFLFLNILGCSTLLKKDPLLCEHDKKSSRRSYLYRKYYKNKMSELCMKTGCYGLWKNELQNDPSNKSVNMN